jgi:hypothetical protein
MPLFPVHDEDGIMNIPTDRKRLQALERYVRHLQRRLEATGRKLDGIDAGLRGMLRDARKRLRRLERLLGE